MRALSVEDKAEKRKAKKERQRIARAQAAAREAPDPAVGSSAGLAAHQLPSSAQRSSPASPKLQAAEQKPSTAAQAGAPAFEAVLQAAGHISAEPAEALPQPASGEGGRRVKGKGNLNRSGALPTGSVHSDSAVQSTSLAAPGGIGAAALLSPQTSGAQAADERTSAMNSPAEHSESLHSALPGSSSAQRLQRPIYEATSAAYQHQDGGSSTPSSGQHTALGSQALTPAPARPEEESWQEVRPERRKRAAKSTAAKAGKGRSSGQTLPEALPKPTAAVPTIPQRAHRLQAPPGSAAGPELPGSGPTQADLGETPQWPALHALSQRQPAQSPIRAAPAAMHGWPPLQASARPEPEHIPEFPELTAAGAPQQNLDHEALLKDLLLQPKASSTTTEQHTVHTFQEALPIVYQCIHQASTSLQSFIEAPAYLLMLLPADCHCVALTGYILRSDPKSCKCEAACCCRLQPAQMSVNRRVMVRKRMITSALCALMMTAL